MPIDQLISKFQLKKEASTKKSENSSYATSGLLRLFSRLRTDKRKQETGNIEKKGSIRSTDIEGVQRDLDKILSRIYEENKRYFPHGLYKERYNGNDDVLEIIKDEETGAPAGFRGVQVRTNPENKRVAYYSIGVLPEFRGKGLAEKAMIKSLLEEGDKFDMNAYTVNKENRPSLFLYKKLLERFPEMKLQLRLKD